MKIFLDTANVDEIKQAMDLGVIAGVTTNPSLMAKTSGATFKDIILSIAKMVPGPVSAEVTAQDAQGMIKQALEIVDWSNDPDFRERITIKVPMNMPGTKVVNELSRRGIATNCTLIFSVNQALLACEAGATFISPFVGRLDDAGHEGIDSLTGIIEMVRVNNYNSQIIAASVRHPVHVMKAALAGCDIATIPFSVLKQIYSHPMTEAGIRKFEEDWKKFQDSLK